MLVSDFNYELPDDRIAKFPPEKRGSTRLLVLNRETGAIKDDFYRNLADFLNPGDLIILNDTRVIPARLLATLPDGRPRELVVLETHGDDNTNKVLYRGKLRENDILNLENHQIKITKILGNGLAEINSDISLAELTERYGAVPLPPYLHRSATENDKSRYQTLWASRPGSAAAPTASLNMTTELLEKLQSKNINIAYLTLHVGLGTFLPIRTDAVEDHHMHSEWYHIPEQTLAAIQQTKNSHHRVVAVGTTVARTLEFYAKTNQPTGEDDIFIYPGFEFKLVDALLTNFHAPKSTVLMLAAAFAGWENLKPAYTHALAENYNFLSYGDSMFIC